MLTLLLVGGIASVLTALIGVLVALRVQYRWLSRERIERDAWEVAQESYHLHWENKQRRRRADFEQQLTSSVEQIHGEWRVWEAKDRDRVNRLRQEYELLHLPTVEETPLGVQGYQASFSPVDAWQAPAFYQADLRGQDFSHRYLGYADMREAQLSGASFYMADLRNACLAGADLHDAVLTGANLSNADLRGATLTNATFLVADLHGALLSGANLLGARSLTAAQLYTASYDHTTILDPDIDVTMPRRSVSLPLTPVPESLPALEPPLGQLDRPLLSPQSSGDIRRDPSEAVLPGR
jgi:hypothetical protein